MSAQLRRVETPPVVAEYVTTHCRCWPVAYAGYGVGFSTAAARGGTPAGT